MSSLPPQATSAQASLREWPDERVIPLALDGDRSAWDALIARHERRVFLTLLARGVRADRARDLVQETWARLIEMQRDGRLSFLELPGLAIKQAIFLAMDEARRGQRDVSLDESPEIDLVSDPEPSAEERLAKRAALAAASAELARCSPASRRVFELVYAEPSTPHAEAARRLGISVQRVRQTLCEVRARLKGAIAEAEGASTDEHERKEGTDERAS